MPSLASPGPAPGAAGVTPVVTVHPPHATRTSASPGPGAAIPTGTSAPTTPPATGKPAKYKLTSPGGTVKATCPAPSTAQILSAKRTKPLKVLSVDTTPGPAPTAVFKHGKYRVTMTITCQGGVPSTVNTITD
jgi:hypothetical protein